MEVKKILIIAILFIYKPSFSQESESEFPLFEGITSVYQKSNLLFYKNNRCQKVKRKQYVLVNRTEDCSLESCNLLNFSYIQFDKLGENGKERIDTFKLNNDLPKLRFLEIASSFCYFDITSVGFADSLEYFFCNFQFEVVEGRYFEDLKNLKYLELNADSINARGLEKCKKLETLILNCPVINKLTLKGRRFNKLGLTIGCDSNSDSLLEDLKEVDFVDKLYLFSSSTACINFESFIDFDFEKFRSVLITIDSAKVHKGFSEGMVYKFLNSNASENSIYFKIRSHEFDEKLKAFAKERDLHLVYYDDGIVLSIKHESKSSSTLHHH